MEIIVADCSFCWNILVILKSKQFHNWEFAVEPNMYIPTPMNFSFSICIYLEAEMWCINDKGSFSAKDLYHRFDYMISPTHLQQHLLFEKKKVFVEHELHIKYNVFIPYLMQPAFKNSINFTNAPNLLAYNNCYN